MQRMEPTAELIDQLRREEIEQARRMTVKQKLEAGGDLFDMACAVTLSGIREQNPGMSSKEAMDVLRRRLERARKTETRL
jgi:hypothetical protein